MPFDRSIIERYTQAGPVLRDAVAGLSPSEMTSFPIPGTWSIQQVVMHLQDSDLIGADRMKRIAAEKNPLLVGYDENAFTSTLCYDEQSLQDALTLFEISRRQFAAVLRKLPDAAFDKVGIHTEVGKVTLGSQLQKYIEHFEHHLKFIYAKRAKLGKPMPEVAR